MSKLEASDSKESPTGLPDREEACLRNYLEEKRRLIDRVLEKSLPRPDHLNGKIVEAMRYSLFSGGKRLRPILTLAGAEAVGGDVERTLPAACAIELIHTYSLIHDDLPSVDDDDFRRGKPSSHKVFGEAMAIFAGDALLTHAFTIITDVSRSPAVDPALLMEVTALISEAVGVRGMIGGQVVDIISQGKEIEPPVLEYIHCNKTAALIRVSVLSGAILGRGDQEQIKGLGSYGYKIGLAFQIVDDLLDHSSSAEAENSDQRLEKATYPAVHGVGKSRLKAASLVEEAVSDISHLSSAADPLRWLARFIVSRDH